MNKRTGLPLTRCHVCRKKYSRWGALSAAEKASRTDFRDGLRTESGGPPVYKFVFRSNNQKIGPIPLTGSPPHTCPPSCGLYGAGCYAEQFIVGMFWRRLARGEGMRWPLLMHTIRNLPQGQLWRHNEMGDLAGAGEALDREQLWELVGAARGQRGFTYTHKRSDLKMVRLANENGFTVNLSTDNPEQADEYANEGSPVVTVLPHNAPTKGNMTPKRLPIVVCPAEYQEGKQCANCGLCQDRFRGFIIGFRAHGAARKMVSERQNRQLPLFKESK